MSTLDSRIILCKGINLDKDYINVLNINDANMLTLCNSKAVYTTSNMQFLSPLKKVRVDCPYSTCFQCNYLALQNPSYGAKWYFAFITEINYISDKVTEISFEVDEWTTWFSYLGLKDCYVIREHVSNDTIGLHTINENLDVGEIITLNSYKDTSLATDLYVVISSNYNPITEKTFDGVTAYSKSIFGSELYFFDFNNQSLLTYITGFLHKCNKDGKIGDVHEMYIIPKKSVSLSDLELKQLIYEDEGKTYTISCEHLINMTTAPHIENINKSKVHSFTDYTPKNNKCYCYPYNFLEITNGVGNTEIYRYEDFSNTSDYTFQEQFSLGVSGSGRIVPTNYRGIPLDYNNQIPLAKYPICQWSSDSYTSWLRHNVVNLASQTISLGSNLLSGNLIGTAGSIANLIGSFDNASLLPQNINGSNTGDVNFSSNNNTFVINEKRCKLEFLKIIDNYFSRYGYKVLELKTPNLSSRAHWNYIQIR